MIRDGLNMLKGTTLRQRRTAFIITVLVSTVIFSLACFLPLYESYTPAALGYSVNGQFHFPWYDSENGKTWVMLAQPWGQTGGSTNVQFYDYAASTSIHSPQEVAMGSAAGVYLDGFVGGPVSVTTIGYGLLVSERTLFGNSFEEVWATPDDKLDSNYYWPWYDNLNMNNWVMVSNPSNNGHVRAQVKIKGGHQQEKVLAPGESWPAAFPGVMNGPVEVKAWSEGGSEGNPLDARKVIASQRVLWNGAFNEVPGISASSLDSAYVWTWYDSASPGAFNWISVSNPDPVQPVFVEVFAGSESNPVLYDYAWVAGNTTVNFRQPAIGGPVYVIGSQSDSIYIPEPIVATQRVLWGPSFSEIAGTSPADLSSFHNWTWYDMKSPGVTNFIVIANLDDETVYYSVHGAGYQYLTSGLIEKGGIAYPLIPGYIGGPLQVTAFTEATGQSADVLASQRVLWNGYFNEIVGHSN